MSSTDPADNWAVILDRLHGAEALDRAVQLAGRARHAGDYTAAAMWDRVAGRLRGRLPRLVKRVVTEEWA